MISDPTRDAHSSGSADHAALSRRARARRLLVVLFVVLVVLFAAGLWGTVVRSPAYEVRGEVVARAAPDLLLVKHQAVTGLGMGPMEMMAVRADPAALDRAQLAPGERVRLAVRQSGDEIVLVWVERLP
jgi:hypothetical protein